MDRWVVMSMGILFSILLSSCVVSTSNGNVHMTGSIEEFRIKYPDLNPTYYDDVINIECQIANGKMLYDRYYRVKMEENKVDYETRRGALEIFSRILQRLGKIASETDAHTIMALRSDVSQYMQDLLREVEMGEKENPSVP